MKNKLTTAPISVIPTGNRGLVVYNDAFHLGLGCVLMQYGKVITYVFGQLRPYELFYLIHELELDEFI